MRGLIFVEWGLLLSGALNRRRSVEEREEKVSVLDVPVLGVSATLGGCAKRREARTASRDVQLCASGVPSCMRVRVRTVGVHCTPDVSACTSVGEVLCIRGLSVVCVSDDVIRGEVKLCGTLSAIESFGENVVYRGSQAHSCKMGM